MNSRITNRPSTPLALGLAAVCALSVACSAPQQTSSDETVQMREQAVNEIEEERAESTRHATIPPPDERDQEEIVVEMFEVRADQPARAESGLAIHLLSPGPSWSFELDHHGRKTRLKYAGAPLYIEGHAYGHLYVISQLGEVVQVTLRANVPDESLTPDQAYGIARRERASRLGCEGAREETALKDNGTAVLRVVDVNGAETCRIVVGRYTKQVVDQ